MRHAHETFRALSSVTTEDDARSARASGSVAETRDSLLRGIGSDADDIAVIQREQAALDAVVVTRLAAAARKANWLATLPGGSLEHSRRSLVAEIATTLLIPEATAAQRIDESHHSDQHAAGHPCPRGAGADAPGVD